MPTYLFTAKSPEGKSVTERVDAATTEGARYALNLRGYREIVFHTDDSSNRIDEVLLAEMTDGDVEFQLTPEQERKAHQGGGVFRELWSAWKMNAIFWMPIGIWVGINLINGRPFTFGDLASFVVGGLFLVYFIWLVLPSVGYQSLLAAATWNRLVETRAWVGFLRFFGSIGPVRIPKLELDMRLAGVLGRNGLEAEARRLVAPYENAATKDSTILSRVAGFYHLIGDHDHANAIRAQAVDISSGGLTEVIDHAHALVRHLRRPEDARISLARIGDRELTDLARVFVLYTEGLIALDELRIDESIDLLAKTEQAVSPYAANELMKGMLREIWTFRAIAFATAGQQSEAKEFFQKALPLLKARREDDLIARFNDLLRRPTASKPSF